MIKLTNISKTYTIKKGEYVRALNNVNLYFPTKGLVFITGKSGSGKTTLLNILGGLDSSTSGELEIYGKNIKEYSEKNYDDYRNNMVGFVFQDYNLINDYTVEQNIALALELQKDNDKIEKIKKALKIVGLEGYGNRNIKQLSGGQKQRVAIARAIVKKSKIILADEPTGNLDSVTSEEIYTILKKIAENTLVVVVSHDIENAEKYADRLIKMKDGEIHKDDIRNGFDTEYDSSEKLQINSIKSGNISAMNIFKMGFRNLWKHKFRLLITAVLFMITLSIIGSGVALISKNPYDRYSESYLKAEKNSFTVELLNEDLSKNLSLQDYKQLEKFSNKSIMSYNCSFEINGMEQSNKYRYYDSRITGITVINDLTKQSDFSIYCGQLSREGEREICISLFTAQSILENEREFCKVNKISDINDLINKEINFKNDRGQLRISGIIDTNVDKYFDDIKAAASYKWEKYGNDDNTLYGQYLINYLPYSLHRNIIVNAYFMENYYCGTRNYRGEFQQHLIPKDDSYIYPYPDDILYSNIINSSISNMTNVVGEQIVGNDEIILNEKIFLSYMHEDSAVKEIGDDGYYYIDFCLYDTNNLKKVNKKLKVKGYIVGEFEPCIISANVFEEIVDKTILVNSIQFYLKNKAEDRELFEYISKNRNIRVYDEVYRQVEDVNDTIEVLIMYGGYILIGIAVFTILMMMNFIVSTINSTRHEIGILRALGTKQSSVFAIYFIEMLILCLMVWIISIFLSMGISIICSNIITKNASLIVKGSIMPIGIISLSVMLIFSVFIALSGSAIPILTKTNKKPIDLLK